ncbi:MAG: hypothetical protein ACYC91_17815 [Solirubrobacteraceae bacterium]
MRWIARRVDHGRHSLRRIGPSALPLAFVLALGAALLWTRLTGLGVSFWRDEIYSVVHYASRGPGSIWLGHYEPNDHVLFNFLSWATSGLLGRSETVYRLWSVGPAIAGIGVVTWWLRRTWSPWLAVIFAGLAVTSPLHLELAKQARGYGLGFLAGGLLLLSAVSIARGGGPRAYAGLAAAGLIGIWTLTGFLLAFVGQASSLLPSKRARRGTAVVTLLVVAGGLVFYAPLLGAVLGPLSHPGSYFKAAVGSPLGWDAFLLGPPDQFLGPTFRHLLGVHSSIAYEVIGVGLAASGGAGLWRSGERLVLFALAGPLVFTEASLTLLHVSVNPRFVSFLLFHFLVLVALGVIAWGRVAARARGVRWVVPVAGVTLIAVLAVRLVALNEHWDAVPIENFKQVARVVHRAGFADVVTDSVRPRGLRYYLGIGHVQVLSPEHLEALFCHSRQPLAYVDHLAYPEITYAGDPLRPMPVTVSCLRSRGATLISVPEREHGLPVDVWLLRPGVVNAPRTS